jgi:hypothetical protein
VRKHRRTRRKRRPGSSTWCRLASCRNRRNSAASARCTAWFRSCIARTSPRCTAGGTPCRSARCRWSCRSGGQAAFAWCRARRRPCKPFTQAEFAHGPRGPHWPLALHVCTPLFEHCFDPGTQTPMHARIRTPKRHGFAVAQVPVPEHVCTPLLEQVRAPARTPAQKPAHAGLVELRTRARSRARSGDTSDTVAATRALRRLTVRRHRCTSVHAGGDSRTPTTSPTPRVRRSARCCPSTARATACVTPTQEPPTQLDRRTRGRLARCPESHVWGSARCTAS